MPKTRIATPLEEEVLTLRGKNRQLKSELKEEEELRGRMEKILHETANALHGGPLEHGSWSWHDLPELAAQLLKDKEYFETLAIDRGWQLDAERNR